MTNSPFSTRRTFSINLSGTPVEIDAEIAFASYTIMRATDAAGRPFDVSLDDLEVFETTVERMIERTETRAVNLETGQTETFTVASLGSDILAIQNAGGYVLPRCCPTWSEVAESWHLDREYTEAVESDQPRRAALAGFLHPRPLPNQQGHGLRRAA